MEERILWWIREQHQPWLDLLFRASHEFGTGRFCTGLVIACALWWLWRRRPREAILWLVLGIAVFFLQLGLKEAFGRLRPALWDGPIRHHSYAFPSGHALAAACLYPLLARAASLRFPHRRRTLYGLAIAFAGYVGFGRLYLGVHWPTDVLAGWTLGALLLWLGVTLIAPQRMLAGRSRAELLHGPRNPSRARAPARQPTPVPCSASTTSPNATARRRCSKTRP